MKAQEVDQALFPLFIELIDQNAKVSIRKTLDLWHHPFRGLSAAAPDVVTETIQRDYLQKLALATQDGLYLVPKVIELILANRPTPSFHT